VIKELDNLNRFIRSSKTGILTEEMLKELIFGFE
jgi:hypothetical protein